MAKTLTRFLTPLMLTLFLTSPALGQERREIPEFRTYGEAGSIEEGAAIDFFLKEFKAAWARQDTDALIALHDENVEWINAYARLFQGAEPLRDFLANRLFPEFDPEVSRQEVANMKTISIRFLEDDAVVVHLYTDGNRGPSRNQGEAQRRTHLHLVLAKQGKEWKIVHTAIMDAR